jgi:HTH-type transcriptional regulator, sugar sensing transcriptional regulator
MDLVNSLKNLGLNEKEAKIYLALLQMGESTAYTVAKHSGLKKPNTYVILENLIGRGIVHKVPRTNTKEFVAIAPDELIAVIKSKVESAEKDALPELKAISKGKEYKVNVSYYEGLDGVKEMYNKLIKEAKGREIKGFYAHQRDTVPELEKYFWEELNPRLAKNNIKRKAITTSDPSVEKYFTGEIMNKWNLKAKALDPKKYNSNISIEIYKNKTMILSQRYLQGVIIDNPDVANVMKQIFNLVWERNSHDEVSCQKD